MKTVIKPAKNKDATIESSLATCEKYYGVVKSEEKGFITQTNYGHGRYIAICSRSVTYRNTWPDAASDTLEATLNWFLDHNGEAYEFDTPKELFAWLAS